jgi:hypothetical protein
MTVLKRLTAVLAIFVGSAVQADDRAPAATFPAGTQFEITLASGLSDQPIDGRLLLVLGKSAKPEPRRSIGATGLKSQPIFGRDVLGLKAGDAVVIDELAIGFPVERLSAVAPGEYFAQAVLMCNRDLLLDDSPGNLYSKPVQVRLGATGRSGDASAPERLRIELTEKIGDESVPENADNVRFVKFRSELLSQFHGRPMYLRAGVILPRDFDQEPDRHYPLRVTIGGYGSRYTGVRQMMRPMSPFRAAWMADGGPRMILLHLDGAGPLGDPYQVNSANNGPYGDAVTQELIPFIEKTYRGIGQPWARVLDGGSTGGWVSLALQVFYPDEFNGCWSGFPDGVDFRGFQLIDIYRDDNAYLNRYGFERPSKRTQDGDVEFTVRHECQMENVLGRGDSWTLSGQQWGAWNATYGPRGGDGRPIPLWDARTGKIDASVAEKWKKNDLRLVLEQNWETLGPKLRGKLHVWVGEADDYFLNKGVHLLDDFLSRAEPAYEGWIRYSPRGGHGWSPLGEAELMREMMERIEKSRR